MKKLGSILENIVGKENLVKFRQEKNIFESWEEILCKAFEDFSDIVGAAAAHTNITSIKNTILFIEADHTGWIQILQTRADALLDVVKKNFTKWQISKIEFHLRRENHYNL